MKYLLPALLAIAFLVPSSAQAGPITRGVGVAVRGAGKVVRFVRTHRPRLFGGCR